MNRDIIRAAIEKGYDVAAHTEDALAVIAERLVTKRHESFLVVTQRPELLAGDFAKLVEQSEESGQILRVGLRFIRSGVESQVNFVEPAPAVGCGDRYTAVLLDDFPEMDMQATLVATCSVTHCRILDSVSRDLARFLGAREARGGGSSFGGEAPAGEVGRGGRDPLGRGSLGSELP